MAVTVDAAQNDAAPLGVRLLSASELSERALRKVRAFAINDEEPDPSHMAEALSWLDLIVGEVTGNRRCYWLTPDTVTFDWPGLERNVVLADQMGADYPSTGIQFPIRAWVVDATTGLRQGELELCRRSKYEAKTNLDTGGMPEILYIDRLVANQKAYTWPVPTADDLWQVALEFQRYTQSVLGADGSNQAGDVPHGFSQEWQLFLITRLAAEIGDGPVMRCAKADVKDWRDQAAQYLSNLLYANREKTSRRPVTRRYGG